MRKKSFNRFLRTVSMLSAALIPLSAITVFASGCDAREDGYVTVSPEKISGKLDNPGMGWSITEDGTFLGVLDNGETGDYDGIDAINYTSTWALMEPTEGEYDWSLLDEAIEKWGDKLGKILHLRITTDSFMLPSTYTGAPYWLADKYNVPTQTFNYTSVSPVPTAVAYDVTDENYLRALDKFLAALADHIRDVECIGDIDLRGYGLWGEWHTGFMFDTTNAKRNALITIIDHWQKAFEKDGHLLVLSSSWDPNYNSAYGVVSGDAYSDFYSWAALDYAFQFDNVTYRRDGAGAALLEQDRRLMAETFDTGKDVYLHAEFANGAQSHLESSSVNALSAVNDMLYGCRPNYSTIIGWTTGVLNDYVKSGNLKWLDRGYEKLGYRLCVDLARYPQKASAGHSFDVFTSWSNTGVGRFTYDYDLTYYLVDGGGKAVASYTDKQFNAGKYVLGEINDVYTKVELPASLAGGKYTLCYAITNEKGEPAIELGNAGRRENTKMYALGEIEVSGSSDVSDDFAVRTDFNGLKNYAFKPSTTYTVTFGYTPSFGLNQYALGSTAGYVFKVASGNSVACYENWKDVSKERGSKTVTFTTGSGGAYKADIYSDKFGEIEIHDCYIRASDTVLRESFKKNTDLTDFSASFTTSAGNTSRILHSGSNDGTVISGEASVRVYNKKSNAFSYGLYGNESSFALAANQSYTLSFLQSSTSSSIGNYYLVALWHEDTDTYETIGEWYDHAVLGVTQKTFTFTTDERGGTLVFGLYNAGEYVLDDITLVKNPSGNRIAAGEGYFPRNQKKTFHFGVGVMEDFESGALNATGFELGAMNMFKMTKDPNLVINGNYSVLIYNEQANYNSLYFEQMWSQMGYYEFEPLATYKVTFKFKEIYSPKSAKAYVMFRNKDQASMDNYNLYAYFTGGNPGENSGTMKIEQCDGYSIATWTVTLKDVKNYQFGICYYNYQVLTIDDILIEKVDS